MSMERRESWRESLPLRAAIDRLFEDAFVRFDRAIGPGGREFAVDLAETEQGFEIHAALPGVRPEDVNVTVENQTLTIEGTWQNEEAREDQQWHLRERSQGHFLRTIRLPAPVDGEHVEAHTDQGVLTVRLPKAPAAQRRRIAIGGQSGASGRPAGANGNVSVGDGEGSTRAGAPSVNAGPGGRALAHGESAASGQLVSGTQPRHADPVTAQSDDSFPASDPPSYTPERV